MSNLYLIPNTLGGEIIDEIMPQDVKTLTSKLRYFAVEEIKSARRLLRKIDRTFPIDDCVFFILNKKTPIEELYKMINVLKEGNDLGIISEAGCPGVADPGAELVALAHQKNYTIKPLVGPSSILLALMGSGFNGQKFTFHGYLPKERKERIYQLKNFEADAKRNQHTHIFMDTPFRNMNVLDDLLNELADITKVCIASNLTLLDQSIQTMTVKDWRENAYDLAKKPTMFLIGS